MRKCPVKRNFINMICRSWAVALIIVLVALFAFACDLISPNAASLLGLENSVSKEQETLSENEPSQNAPTDFEEHKESSQNTPTDFEEHEESSQNASTDTEEHPEEEVQKPNEGINEMLLIPSGLSTEEKVLTWEAVGRAIKYIVRINTEEFETSENSFSLENLQAGRDYIVQVRALGENGLVSEWSASFSYHAFDLPHIVNAEGFLVNGNELYRKVGNEITSFDFSDVIEVPQGVSWLLSGDENGENIIITKRIALQEPGDKTVYIIAYNEEGDKTIYRVTVRRKAIYTVTYLIKKEETISKEVEEDEVASPLNESQIPERIGFEFTGYDYDFSKPITADILITLQWKTDANYLDGKGEFNEMQYDFEVLDSSTDKTLTGWYYLSADLTASEFTVSEEAHIILADNVTLSLESLYVPQRSSLFVYAQSFGENAGALNITNNLGGKNGEEGTENVAGTDGQDAGTITINGGKIAVGHIGGGHGGNGKSAEYYRIYGGTAGGNGGSIVAIIVNNGSISATSIGGGSAGNGGAGADRGTQSSSGASGDSGADGANGGNGGSFGIITINGGSLSAEWVGGGNGGNGGAGGRGGNGGEGARNGGAGGAGGNGGRAGNGGHGGSCGTIIINAGEISITTIGGGNGGNGGEGGRGGDGGNGGVGREGTRSYSAAAGGTGGKGGQGGSGGKGGQGGNGGSGGNCSSITICGGEIFIETIRSGNGGSGGDTHGGYGGRGGTGGNGGQGTSRKGKGGNGGNGGVGGDASNAGNGGNGGDGSDVVVINGKIEKAITISAGTEGKAGSPWTGGSGNGGSVGTGGLAGAVSGSRPNPKTLTGKAGRVGSKGMSFNVFFYENEENMVSFDWTSAVAYYYSEEKPMVEGNYWHYNSDETRPEIWMKEKI